MVMLILLTTNSTTMILVTLILVTFLDDAQPRVECHARRELSIANATDECGGSVPRHDTRIHGPAGRYVAGRLPVGPEAMSARSDFVGLLCAGCCGESQAGMPCSGRMSGESQ